MCETYVNDNTFFFPVTPIQELFIIKYFYKYNFYLKKLQFRESKSDFWNINLELWDINSRSAFLSCILTFWVYRLTIGLTIDTISYNLDFSFLTIDIYFDTLLIDINCEFLDCLLIKTSYLAILNLLQFISFYFDFFLRWKYKDIKP